MGCYYTEVMYTLIYYKPAYTEASEETGLSIIKYFWCWRIIPGTTRDQYFHPKNWINILSLQKGKLKKVICVCHNIKILHWSCIFSSPLDNVVHLNAFILSYWFCGLRGGDFHFDLQLFQSISHLFSPTIWLIFYPLPHWCFHPVSQPIMGTTSILLLLRNPLEWYPSKLLTQTLNRPILSTSTKILPQMSFYSYQYQGGNIIWPVWKW